MGRADLLYLERWQIKKLRHLARSPVHITRETNDALRRRVQVPTIESQLRVRRLKWWRQLLAPRFGRSGTAANRVTLGMPALLFAHLCSVPNKRNRPTAISKSLMRFPMDVYSGLTGLTDDDLSQLFRYDSTLDVVRQPAELIPCPQCGRILKGTKGLATHCRSKHGTKVQMADTPGQTCPRCRKHSQLAAT